MNSKQCSVARIISTGFVVSLIFSILLFWANAGLRKIGKADLVNGDRGSLRLSLDLGDEKLSDPNLTVRPPRVVCEFADHRYVESDIFLDRLLKLGYWITGYELAMDPQFSYALDKAKVAAEWYEQLGLIALEQVRVEGEDNSRMCFVGPKGFGDVPDKSLGRFSNPQLCGQEDSSTVFVYDRDLKVFFRIDFALEKVTSKSWADKSIIATSWAWFGKFPDLLQMYAEGAFRLETDQEMQVRLEKERKPLPISFGDYALGMDQEITAGMEKEIEGRDIRQQVPFGPRVHGSLWDSDLWAMDDQGTIYQIDSDTLLLGAVRGQLPHCGIEETHDPSRLLAYSVLPLFADKQYLGLVAASLSRDSSNLVVAMFDSRGREKSRRVSHLVPQRYQYGLITSYARTVLDFAQPLAFSAASSLWGPRTEAIAGYRSLFVLPMSMPGRLAGDRALKVGDRVGTVIMWNVFTWCVGLLLAIAVMRDLKQLDMSSKTQNAWLFACMGFGWIAVITYLLTRSRIQFVTCTGCGRTRRTDQENCQHCDADWAMCDLQVPGWRVID